MICRTATDRRRAELAKIHLAKRDLGLDDDTYRDLLWTLARVRSAADLDAAGRAAVLDHFKARGWRGKRRRDPGSVSAAKTELIAKIEAQLSDMSAPWGYADGIAKQMFGISSVRFCDPVQLRTIVAALAYEQKKRWLLESIQEHLDELGWNRSHLDRKLGDRGWSRNLRSLQKVLNYLAEELDRRRHAND